MKRLNQTGSHLLGIVLVVLVVGIVAFAGYKVWQTRDTNAADQASTITVPETITTAKDLEDTSAALDQSLTELDSSLDDSSLDDDLDSML